MTTTAKKDLTMLSKEEQNFKEIIFNIIVRHNIPDRVVIRTLAFILNTYKKL